MVIPNDLQITTRGERFLLHDTGVDNVHRIIIFCTDENLRLLTRHQHWFGDGTFRVVSKLFSELDTIHAIINNEIVPMVYALCENHTQNIYFKIFDIFRQYEAVPLSFLSDFERAAQNAIIQVFPNVTVKGCLFHYGQCIWRKIQEYGLQLLYTEDENIRFSIEKLIALAFLPVADVINAFEDMIFEPRINELVNHFEDEFIGTVRR